jgi:hypothetical protein
MIVAKLGQLNDMEFKDFQRLVVRAAASKYWDGNAEAEFNSSGDALFAGIRVDLDR